MLKVRAYLQPQVLNDLEQCLGPGRPVNCEVEGVVRPQIGLYIVGAIRLLKRIQIAREDRKIRVTAFCAAHPAAIASISKRTLRKS